MPSSALKCLLLLIAAAMAAGFQFEVGGKNGWRKPTGKEAATYNEWAASNRFHIGDTLHFKYGKDSVAAVSGADYLNCNASSPIATFEDGDTVFQLDRSGFFYFISGNLRHCRSGQKLIVRVMHPSESEPPELAPSPSASGDFDWAPPAASSTTKLAIASYHIAAACAGLLAILYFFA